MSAARGTRPPLEGDDETLVEQAVRRSVQPKESAVRAEVQRLLDATLAVIRRTGTEAPPKVADIVAEAGLSNQAFYRHFASRDDLLAAVVEAGALRLVSYLEHQMAKETEPASRVRQWIEGVLAQASKATVAKDTRAVLWSARGAHGGRPATGALPAAEALLVEPLGHSSRDPERDAAMIASAVFGRLEYHLWVRPPLPADVEHLVDFCLAAVGMR
jgi:AcrR family transcriptional regulator